MNRIETSLRWSLALLAVATAVGCAIDTRDIELTPGSPPASGSGGAGSGGTGAGATGSGGASSGGAGAGASSTGGAGTGGSLPVSRDFFCQNITVPAGPEFVIDDMSDNDPLTYPQQGGRNGSWSIVTDGTLGMSSLLDGADGSSQEVVLSNYTDWGAGALLGFHETEEVSPLNGEPVLCGFDASRFRGVRFDAKTNGGPANQDIEFLVNSLDVIPVAEGGRCEGDVGCWDAHRDRVSLTGDWQEFEIEWGDLTQAFTATPTEFNPGEMTSFLFRTNGPGEHHFQLSDLEFLPHASLQLESDLGAAGDFHGYFWPIALTGATIDRTSFGNELCASGTLPTDFAGFGGIGWNLFEAVDPNTMMSLGLGEFAPQGTAVGLTLQNREALRLRVQVETLDGSGRWCANIDFAAPGTEDVRLEWSDFTVECWEPGGEAYDGSPIGKMLIYAPVASAASESSYDFCVDDIRWFSN